MRLKTWGSEPDSYILGGRDLGISEFAGTELDSKIRDPEPDTPFQPFLVGLRVRIAVIPGVGS